MKNLRKAKMLLAEVELLTRAMHLSGHHRTDKAAKQRLEQKIQQRVENLLLRFETVLDRAPVGKPLGDEPSDGLNQDPQ